jgi:hypothetical protein
VNFRVESRALEGVEDPIYDGTVTFGVIESFGADLDDLLSNATISRHSSSGHDLGFATISELSGRHFAIASQGLLEALSSAMEHLSDERRSV